MVHLLVFILLATESWRADRVPAIKSLAEFSLARTFLEDVLCHRQRRKDVRPADIKSQVRQGLGCLGLSKSVVHRPIQVVGNLCNLTRSYQGADRYQTAIARRQVRAQPKVAKQQVRRVLYHSGCNRAELLFNASRALRLGSLVERKKLR